MEAVLLSNLMELAGFFTAHAVWMASSRQGPLVPHVIQEKDGERSLLRLDRESSMEAAVKKGQDTLDVNEDGADRGIVFFDAFVTFADERLDALVVRGFEYGSERVEVEIIQPYRPVSAAGGFAVMQPKVSFPEEHVDDADALVEAFFRGLDSHEEGGPLWTESILAGS